MFHHFSLNVYIYIHIYIYVCYTYVIHMLYICLPAVVTFIAPPCCGDLGTVLSTRDSRKKLPGGEINGLISSMAGKSTIGLSL
jgi:hypothetical protein